MLVYFHLEPRYDWDFAIELPIPPRIGETVSFWRTSECEGHGRVVDVFHALNGCHTLEDAKQKINREPWPQRHVLVEPIEMPTWIKNGMVGAKPVTSIPIRRPDGTEWVTEIKPMPEEG